MPCAARTGAPPLHSPGSSPTRPSSAARASTTPPARPAATAAAVSPLPAAASRSIRGPLLFLTMSVVSTFAFALNLLLFPLFKAWDPMLRHGH